MIGVATALAIVLGIEPPA